MNRSLNVFLGLSICLILFGGMWFLSRVDRDNEGWRPSDMYSQVSTGQAGTSSFTNATLGTSSSNDGVLLSMPTRSFSSRVHTPVFSYAPVSGGAMSGVSLSGGRSSVAAGQGLYTTSSAELRSFGGGNASASAAGGFRSNGQGAIAQASGISSPLSVNSVSYTPVLHTSSSASGDEMLAVAQASNVASASSYAGMGYTTATYGIASYGSTYGSSSARGMSSRRNALGFGDSWWVWFDTWLSQDPDGDGVTNGAGYGSDGSYTFDKYTLMQAYNDFINSGVWNTGMSGTPSFEEWLDWYLQSIADSENGYHIFNNHEYHWLPIGDVWPLFVMLFVYAVYVLLRRRKTIPSQID